MRRVTVAGLIGAILVLGFGAAPANAVANGKDASTGMFPFAVKLTMTDIPKPDGSTYDSACSAGLISPQWIATAGHCFHDVNGKPVSGPVPYDTTATVGKANTDDESGTVVDVVEVRQSGVNDVALAKLAEPVHGVTTLDVATSAPEKDDALTLAGWGATEETNPVPSTQLRYGKVAVGSVAESTAGVHGVWPSADTSACTYDSGAPYFAGNTLVSVESDGPGCPHDGEETTARVDILADWIHQQIG
ncbi:S1 family peptidase [Amycolatopsis nigrescens]|uniref:S1 family peptidase n=1 Tax=Amycolatopsis nigrescens TaxID=381445 RepID=UPI00036CCC49|nr:trypsin-like serine protease [Amycolatopsis nigrescens]